MNLITNLICFKHCCPTSIFCKEVPEKCPICDNYLATFSLEPFVIPYPLVNAKDYPCSIVVRPSTGDFLDDYNVINDLHIGITNSEGNVIEFDKCGIVINDIIKWQNCAAISLIPKSWQTFWDQVLTDLCNNSEWNPNNYNAMDFNCFNFVISFFENLKYEDVQFMSKEEMCEVFILPKIQNILKYASIYKYLKHTNIYIQE